MKRKATKTARAANAAPTPTRAERWRKIATARLAELADKGVNLAALRTVAKIEGVAPVEIVMRNLLERRGHGATVIKRPENTILSPSWNAYIDTDYERNAPTRTRNAHDREVVNAAIFDFILCSCLPMGANEREKVRFVRLYWRRGDTDGHAAYRRMLQYALAPETPRKIGHAMEMLDEREYQTLQTAADALNACRWCDGGNTPETVWDDFLSPVKCGWLEPRELCDNILDGIETGCEDGTPERAARLAELDGALLAAFGLEPRKAVRT